MDNDLQANLRYFSNLVEAETVRIRRLMAPFLEQSNSSTADIFEQITQIMGEFGARVNVIEQAAEQQLLAESPLKDGPLLRGSLNLSVQELDSSGFHESESTSVEQLVCWTKVPEITLKLPCVHAPSDLDINDDRRELGIAISKITSDDSPSSLIGRIFNRQLEFRMDAAWG